MAIIGYSKHTLRSSVYPLIPIYTDKLYFISILIII